MKILKKNQIVIYVLALMLVVAGYLNYTNSNDLNTTIQTSSTEEEMLASSNIGDAQLVSTEVVDENNIQVNTISENTINNNESNNTISNTVETNTNSSSSDYFSTSKLERDTMYSQMLEVYENVLNSSNATDTQKQSAQEEITKINNIKNSIMISENLIKTKGFKNCIIFVNGDSVNIIVEDEDLSQEEIAQIQNIISRELGAETENIHISNK